jgi:hypothetical protein
MIVLRFERNLITEKIFQRIELHARQSFGLSTDNVVPNTAATHFFETDGKKMKVHFTNDHLVFELLQGNGNEALESLTRKMGFRFTNHPSERTGIVDLEADLLVPATSFEMNWCSRLGTFEDAYVDRGSSLAYLRMLIDNAAAVYELDAHSPEEGVVSNLERLALHLFGAEKADKVLELVKENLEIERLAKLNRSVIHEFLDQG